MNTNIEQQATDESIAANGWILMDQSIAQGQPNPSKAFWTGKGWGRLEDAKVFDKQSKHLSPSSTEAWVPEAIYSSTQLYRVAGLDEKMMPVVMLIWAVSADVAKRSAQVQQPNAKFYCTTVLA